jgi:outer membrane usher protein FimD/PapC
VFFAAFGQNSDGSDRVNEPLAYAGLLGYELAPGIVHFAHRNAGRAFASFGIRLGMPLAGAFLGGAAISDCSGDDCQATGIGLGFLLGMGGAIALDAALLAYESPEPRRQAARVMPVVSLARGHAWLGLAGEL